jgi:hypothetical protein
LVAIVLVCIVQGEAAAMRKRTELLRPERVRRSGHHAIAAGSLLLTGGLAGVCLQLVVWISKVIGL